MLHRGVAAAELSNISLLMYFYGQNSLAGSSLQVMGLHGSKRDLGQAQWSVMGGTGDISMARGIINYNITEEDSASRTFKICICVLHSHGKHSGKRQMHFYLLPLSKFSITNFLVIFKETVTSISKIHMWSYILKCVFFE
jgi:hypothetical protein